VQQLAYSAARPQIQTGDLLAFSSASLLYRSLSLGQRLRLWLDGRPQPDSVPAHVGMAAWVADRLWVLEQNTTGGRLVPLSQCLTEYQVDWYGLADSRIRRAGMLEFGLDCLGRPYRYDQLIRMFITREQIAERTGICSGLYQAALLAGGYDWIDSDPMPVECTSLPCLSHVARIVPDAH
jgi:hypothetical protein